mmetsp:Transcript_27553/g.91444  ORF Transcript_27553/g.91444 Transcript_27553/m.91444 type:complete len:745 (-) Transcript_27553:178-2412(-)
MGAEPEAVAAASSGGGGGGGGGGEEAKDEGTPVKRERVVIQLPQHVQPGQSEVEVDVNGGTRLRLLVPEQARPNDRLVLSPRVGGDWDIRILRDGAETPSLRSEPKRVRELSVIVPEGAQAGKTQLSVDAGGGEKLVVTVPECAQPGDQLTFTEGDVGEWTCVLKQQPCARAESVSTSAGGSTGGSVSPMAAAGPCELKCHVPEGAVPGQTQLRLAVGESHVLVAVPQGAAAGELLSVVVRADGSTVARVGEADEGDTKHCVALTRITMDCDKIHDALVAEVREAGGFVSHKIRRGAAPPLNITGMLAAEPIAANEEIVRIPSELMVSIRRCRELLPELSAAVDTLAAKMRDRQEEALHAACLTLLLHAAEARHSGADEPASSSVEGRAAATWRVWSRYADSLLCEDFEEHPYWRHMDEPDALSSLLTPSREFEYMGAMAGDVIAMQQCLKKYVPEKLLGGKFDLGMFLQARLCLLTRVFQLDGDSRMVPVNDCFNHSTEPGVTWSWDDERKDMVLTADRPHAAGEELFISYGKRSNVLLFRTYGFTLPAEVEPDWTFFIRGKPRPEDIFSRYLPDEHNKLCIHLEAQLVSSTLIVALNACKDRGCDPEEFLREVCTTAMRPYEQDPCLQVPIAALRRCRADEGTPDAAQSHAWWSYLPQSAEQRDVRHENALRVKMSEYLCLTAHLEIVDVVAGNLVEERCLAGARPVRRVLLEGLLILRNGSRFSLNSEDVEVGTKSSAALV